MKYKQFWLTFIAFIMVLCMMENKLYAKDFVRNVRVGYFYSDGYQQTDAQGRMSGYGYDFLSLLQRYSNLKFTYVGKDKNRGELLDMLERGEIDLVTSVHKEPERLKRFAFSYPIGQSEIIISVRGNDNRFIPYDFSRLNGITIGFTNGKGIYDKVRDFAKENNFTFTPRYFANNTELANALAQGKVVAIATNSLRRQHNEKIVARFATKDFYAVVNKSDTTLLNAINEAITQINNFDSDWQNHLYNKNYGQNDNSKIEFTPEEKAYIKVHSTEANPIILATDNLWKPFSEKKDGHFIGIIPDYWNRILEMTGMKYRYFDYDGDIFSIDYLKNGKADIYIGTSYNPQEAESQDLLVSPTFMSVGASLLYRKSNTEIHTVAICDITTFLNRSFVNTNNYNIIHFHSSDDAVKALKRGDVDAVYCYTYDAERLENEDPDGSLIYQGIPGINIELRAITNLDSDHTLISIISKCMNELSDYQTETIVSKNLSIPVKNFRLRDWMAVHPFISIFILIVIFAIGIATIFFYIRYRVHKQINKHQQQQLEEISRLNDELKSHQAKLEKATEIAEAANSAKTSFLFNMSHDIRTPMNAIMGFRDLLEKHQDDPVRRADYLSKIETSSNVLLSIINNVLEMARIEKGKIEMDESAWSAEQFYDTIYSIFTDMMKRKGLTFTREIVVQNHYVFCDPIKLREIFINILSNAYKYTNTGGSVNMRLEEIPSNREGYALYRTTISDTGIGMSEEFIPHIFDEFSRENSTTETKIEGTGLGMPIVKRLVEMLGGTIEVKSAKGKGSTFIITIPHRIAEKSNLINHAGVELDPKLFKGKRILLAEDNDLNAEIATEILKEAGFVIERAEDGKICYEMLCKAPVDYYDIILMDIQMPNMNGYEATRTIRAMQDSAKSCIPIIAMTANAFEEDKREAKRSGMDGHVAKPVNINELMKQLASVLG